MVKILISHKYCARHLNDKKTQQVMQYYKFQKNKNKIQDLLAQQVVTYAYHRVQ